MTKTKLSWRLQELPTAGEVAELVDSGVINKDEARDILFKDKTDKDSEEKEALKEQIEFLKGVIETLSKNRLNNWTVVPYTYTIKTPIKKYGWDNTIMYASANMGGSHPSYTAGSRTGEIIVTV